MSNLGEMFNDYVAQDDHKASANPKFYLSDMGKCQRMRWVKRKGVKSRFKPHVYWILQIGNLYHDYAYKFLETKGLLVYSEDYVENDHFRGRFDAITRDPQQNGELRLTDIKSASSWKIKKVLENDDHGSYLDQLMSYVYMIRHSDEEKYKPLKELKSASLFYISKDPKDDLPTVAHESVIPYTNWREEKVEQEMEELVNYWVEDKIPPCTCPAWMKDYNSYLPFCSAPDSKVKEWVEHQREGHQVYSTKTEVVVQNAMGQEVKLT